MRTLALVIGNDKYSGKHKLENAINDAKAIAETFEKLGYEVIYLSDCNHEQFADTLYDFENKLEDFDTAIFYFAGHGFQVEEENYLASIDCNLDNINRFNVGSSCIKLVDILFIFKRVKTKANIVIIDACRKFLDRGTNTSFNTVTAPKGTIIAFSTSPGEGAKDKGMEGHSIYTGSLLKYIGRELLSVEALFKKVRNTVYNLTGGVQTTWEHTSLINDFYFNTGQMVHSVIVPYDESVVKDRNYVNKGDEVDEIISNLQTSDWNKQNPAMDKLSATPIQNLNKNQQFIIGRNILQASGYAHNATNFIEDLKNKLPKYNIGDENHLLNGMLFEIYFNSNGDFRRDNLKGNYIENIFSLRHLPQYKKSFDFINNALEPYKNELFYIPNTVDSIIDVDILATEKEVKSFMDNKVTYQIIESITISGKDITKTISSICQTGTNSKYIKKTISDLLLIPIDLLNINENIPILKLAFKENL
jgi:hypothetical protein